MLSCCCVAGGEASSTVNFQPSDDRTVYDHAQSSGNIPASSSGAAASTYFAPPPSSSPPSAAAPLPEPLDAMPEPPAFEAGDESTLPPPPLAAPEGGPAKGEEEEASVPEAPEPEPTPPAPPPAPASSAEAAKPAADGPHSATSANKDPAVMSGTEKEKMRLQDLVKDFAKRAMKGVGCELVDQHNGSVRPATYFVDKQLQKLTLRIDEHGKLPAAEDTRHVGTISEIFVRRAGSETLRPEVAAALDAESTERLVVISFGSSSLCLLESTAEGATSFAVCMRVLHVYCKQKGLS